jgi:spore maturation protein CgeB
MKLAIFGLTMSSSWGNGHATLWRGLCRALVRLGHDVTFFERDVPYYAAHRDLTEMDGMNLVLYPSWQDVRQAAESEVRAADVAMVTSYCPDAVAATEMVTELGRLSCFYDMDTPTTLDRVARGETVDYVGPREFRDFDLVLSFTGGRALDELRRRLGARRVAPLYGSVDPDVHRPMPPSPQYVAALSYLGTYAAERQSTLERLFVEAARARPDMRFVIGGAQYPAEFPWSDNIFFVRHLPPAEHPSFFCSSPLTLNVTRRSFAEMGHCPSGRLFEAAACGTAIISDAWEGLEQFFTPGAEILVAHSTADTLDAVDVPADELRRIASAARARALDEHSASCRALEMVSLLERAAFARDEEANFQAVGSYADVPPGFAP